jgi:hypothetical protein
MGSIFNYAGADVEENTWATDPDLMVEDIWLNSTTERVSCRIVNMGITYQGMFTVNLTLDGYLYYQVIVDWAPGQGVANVTFPQSIMWSTSTIKVEVEIYYHILAIDEDFTNNIRTEIWNRLLPDFIVRSTYRDPKKGNLIAIIENIGPAKGGGYFHVDLWINGFMEPNEFVMDVIPPGGHVEVPFFWTWDRETDPMVNITIQVDLPGDVDEMNITNNIYQVTWRVRNSLYFTGEPGNRLC